MSALGAQARLLAWYDAQARQLPWRVSPSDRARGVRPDPYRVWLSEIMLQQTTVVHAAPYFLKFLQLWPTVHDLAAARDSDVMSAWAGLGYYARARNLLACARAVAHDHDGRFPDTEEGLRALPGLGPYTAAAVAAIAFDRPANVVDGNVERVMSRLHAVETPLPRAKSELRALAGALVDASRPGDWAQALMDLGAVICRPRAPLCDRCPLIEDCRAHRQGEPGRYPLKAPRAERPVRHGAAFVLTCAGETALERRPAEGLLGGMLGLPTTAWTDTALDPSQILDLAPLPGAWRAAGVVRHVFTHFTLELEVYALEAPRPSGGWIWTSPEGLEGLPSVFLKAVRRGAAG